VGLYLLFLRPGGESLRGQASTPVHANGDIRLYFSNPADSSAQTLRGGIDSSLARAIQEAEYSIDMAAYSFDLWSLRDALLSAHRRGVAVRLVFESDNLDTPEVGALQAAEIPIVADRREHLMHHKFVIIDRLEVWTGSMNYTLGGAYYNDNNLIAIRSSHLAQSYLREFEEMYLEDRFGALSREDTPYPSVEVEGALVEVYFAPEDGAARRLRELLRGAQRRIDFMAYSFTSEALASAILERAQAGVYVRGVMDASGTNAVGSEYARLIKAGIDVRRREGKGKMHHKVILVDGEVLITGSYNFTRSAEEQNDENLLVIHLPSLAEQYLIEFNRLYEMAGP
jgi:phosphatidylserine/phosphatidylglycerophosphate/cardiolipin synthase-like enzyme